MDPSLYLASRKLDPRQDVDAFYNQPYFDGLLRLRRGVRALFGLIRPALGRTYSSKFARRRVNA